MAPRYQPPPTPFMAGDPSLATSGPDPFGQQLLDAIEAVGDIATEAMCEHTARLIATNWHLFSRQQSPLSTLTMFSRMIETKLKCRIANKKGGGEDERKELEELQSMFAALTAVERDDAPGLDTPEREEEETDDDGA